MEWLDLNDWILEHYPEVHAATRYISNMDVQVACWETVYNNHVKPQ